MLDEKIILAVSGMIRDDLLALNELVNNELAKCSIFPPVPDLSFLSVRKPSKPTTSFRTGDLVEYIDTFGHKVRVTVQRVNAKSISGTEASTGKKWRIHPSLVRLVGADKVAVDHVVPITLRETLEPSTSHIPSAAHAGAW